ncbi:MAG: saccharopine dehydrogenase NADP-binding domain-containing protein [Microthrixaceae bacterium]|nr:saccharopine dehydrogenase NADP-binding domain-containing protein [Microthrixaceae bacterium]
MTGFGVTGAAMDTVMVLGGAGGVGRVAVKALSLISDVEHVVVADLDEDAASAVVSEVGSDKLEPTGVDVGDTAALVALLGDAQVVLNCVGPFYRFGPPILEAALRAGVGYVDVCDDLDATRALLDMGDAAREAGVTALIGMGNSPGLANIFVKLCAEDLLDEVTAADICHIHGGEPDEGAGVLKHRIHAMVNDVPLFIDGEFVDVRQLEPSGAAHTREIDFAGVGSYPAYPYPHPETITLPTVFPTLRRATNLGVVYPLSYFSMTQDLVRTGMALEDEISVGDIKVAPIDVAVALLRHERPRLLAEAGVTMPGGACGWTYQARWTESTTPTCSLSPPVVQEPVREQGFPPRSVPRCTCVVRSAIVPVSTPRRPSCLWVSCWSSLVRWSVPWDSSVGPEAATGTVVFR